MSPSPKPVKPAQSGSDEPFEYTTAAGEVITVPSMAVAPRPSHIKVLRANAAGNQAQVALLLIEAAAGDQLAAIEELPNDEQEAFLLAWREHSGVGLGEFKAS